MLCIIVLITILVGVTVASSLMGSRRMTHTEKFEKYEVPEPEDPSQVDTWDDDDETDAVETFSDYKKRRIAKMKYGTDEDLGSTVNEFVRKVKDKDLESFRSLGVIA